MKSLSVSEANQIAQQCVCFNLRKTSRTISLKYDQALRPCGLRATQFFLLIEIKVQAPITIKQLAKKMSMHRTALARSLKALEKKDLIEIEPGHDRRQRNIRLTHSGQKALVRAYPLWEYAQRNVAKHFGKKQLNHLLSELSTMTAKLNSDDT